MEEVTAYGEKTVQLSVSGPDTRVRNGTIFSVPKVFGPKPTKTKLVFENPYQNQTKFVKRKKLNLNIYCYF